MLELDGNVPSRACSNLLALNQTCSAWSVLNPLTLNLLGHDWIWSTYSCSSFLTLNSLVRARACRLEHSRARSICHVACGFHHLISTTTMKVYTSVSRIIMPLCRKFGPIYPTIPQMTTLAPNWRSSQSRLDRFQRSHCRATKHLSSISKCIMCPRLGPQRRQCWSSYAVMAKADRGQSCSRCSLGHA